MKRVYNAGQKKGFYIRVKSLIGFRIFGQVINRVWNIADFGHKLDKGFGKQATHPLPIFLELIPQGIAKVMSCLKLKLEIYRPFSYMVVNFKLFCKY